MCLIVKQMAIRKIQTYAIHNVNKWQNMWKYEFKNHLYAMKNRKTQKYVVHNIKRWQNIQIKTLYSGSIYYNI